MKIIETNEAAKPQGHYVQAMVSGDFVFVSGILPIEAGSSPDPSSSFKKQVECVFRNAEAILHEAGTSLSNVVRVSVYVSDIKNWPEFDKIYGGIFGAHKPARTVAPVPELHYGFDVEVDFIASVSGN